MEKQRGKFTGKEDLVFFDAEFIHLSGADTHM
jgi:hypothetical protein